MAMLSFLAARQTGCDPPTKLVQAECTRRAYSLELSKYLDVQKIHGASVKALDLDLVEKRYLLSGATDGVIGIYDMENANPEPKCTHPTVATVGLSNRDRHKFSVETVKWYPLDTGMFVSSGTDKHLKVWDTNTLRTADEFQFNGIVYNHDMSMIAVQHSLIAVAGQSAKLRLLDLKSGSATHTLKGHKQSVYAVKWSPNQEFVLASGSEDKQALLWDIRRAKGCLKALDQDNATASTEPHTGNTAHNGFVNGVCFTSDGHHILTVGSDDRMRLWNTLTGKNLLINFGRLNNQSQKTNQFAVSYNARPDAVYVPVGSNILMYNIFSGDLVHTLRGHYNQVNCCVTDPINQNLYSSGNDRNILIWTPEVDSILVYENYIRGKDQENEKEDFTKREVVQAPTGAEDAWSSDED